MKRNRLWIIAAALLFVAAGATWYFASPVYAMSKLKTAAQTGDAAELEKRVDFPKVRESLKTQLRARMAREIAKPDDSNPFGKLGAIMAMGMVDGMVEGFVTPESMSAMIQEGKMKRPAPATGTTEGNSAPAKPVDWGITRDGVDAFTATPKSTDGKPSASLRFERHGLGWKLASLKIPIE